MEFAVINTASSGNNTLVAGVTSRRIKVVNYVLVAAGALTIQFLDGSTALTGAMSLITGVPLSSPSAPVNFSNGQEALFQTSMGNALVLALSAGTQVSGHLSFIFE